MAHVNNLPLPDIEQWETRTVLKTCAEAHRYLAELKGLVRTIPNEGILLNTLTLQEAKDSSEVENIITSQDDLYRASISEDGYKNSAAKEVQDYAIALRTGYQRVKAQKLIRLADILEVQELIEKNRAGLRKLPGTELKNAATGETVYSPPQDAVEVESLMENLAQYINDDAMCAADPLVKMAIIHHQFESIHPFYDGNGRTGRIINILYLVAKELLDIPVLYLSRYVIQNKGDYYRELQAVREQGDWEAWILFMLKGVIQTSQKTIQLVADISTLMKRYKKELRGGLPKVYSHELLNNLFSHPYTKIEFVMQDLSVSRLTATKYLEQLCELGLIRKEKIGRSNFYINDPLFALLSDQSY
ncbi:Fic family protein [Reinekea sp. G2M2-21]|uniref:Fic family protein n=1 Tax=Reinekea sp. G2M2-21 TaxID=2788942 RepID=UPI0018AC8AF8